MKQVDKKRFRKQVKMIQNWLEELPKSRLGGPWGPAPNSEYKFDQAATPTPASAPPTQAPTTPAPTPPPTQAPTTQRKMHFNKKMNL